MALVAPKRKRELRELADPFTVAAPSGARIRDRLRLLVSDETVLRLVGEHLGRHQRADLAERVRIGSVRAKDAQRAERKKSLTAVSSSRWAGAITRLSEDQYQLSLRCLRTERVALLRTIKAIRRRLLVPCGERRGKVRGYANQSERFQKQRRLQLLTDRLHIVEERIAAGRPSIVVGGKRLAKLRHHLTQGRLTSERWRQRWDASRLFLTADGESGAPLGNYTISVDPETGTVTIVLPQPLRHLANAPRGRYQLACTVAFRHRREEWLDRVTANRAVRYDIVYEPGRDRWYLDASWSSDKTAPPALEEIKASGQHLLAADLNADHLAACMLDPNGNPIGEPITIPLALTGPASQRDGRLRAAISELLAFAREHHCAGVVVEDLGFADARAAGRETMGRGARGRQFRRTVAGIPTARFRERLRGMAYHSGLVVIAVDPAYTTIWGGQHWKAPLQRQTKTTVTRHHAAAVAIGRRGLGHRIRRRPGVTGNHQRMVARRATGQTAFVPRPRGTASPPRTTGAPHRGDKTWRRRSDQLALFPAPQDRSGELRRGPGSFDTASDGRYRQERYSHARNAHGS
ncbi:hypothetical protein [Streptomyces sp. AC555_RSS877]|uniref:hypothetical protein n=1 Tax=Streptomyces sp. AC555_RSS877 TaxID=2823688 RepID=UPI001C26898B|nr:hypothetical protein [Streptomyces sp. AC555_RSS877]